MLMNGLYLYELSMCIGFYSERVVTSHNWFSTVELVQFIPVLWRPFPKKVMGKICLSLTEALL